MKTLLVPVEQHGLIHAVLETALLFGRRFDAYIEGFAIGLEIPEVAPVDLMIGMPSIMDPGTRRELAQGARQTFESFMLARGAPRHAPALGEVSFGWREDTLQGDSFLGGYGRVFDATVLGRPGTAANHPRLATAESALFESGRPVLIAPPVPPATSGDTIAVAWNASTETTRAVAAAMPLFATAKRVIVLSVEGWGVPGPTGGELVRSLRLNGVAAEGRTVPNTSGRAGETVLAAAASLGCDLLVKGAYTQSRLRQMIFGGATSHILAHATLPVFMAH